MSFPPRNIRRRGAREAGMRKRLMSDESLHNQDSLCRDVLFHFAEGDDADRPILGYAEKMIS